MNNNYLQALNIISKRGCAGMICDNCPIASPNRTCPLIGKEATLSNFNKSMKESATKKLNTINTISKINIWKTI